MYKRLPPFTLSLAQYFITFSFPRIDADLEGGCRMNSLRGRDSNDENCSEEDPNFGAVNAKALRTEVETLATAANLHNEAFTILSVVDDYVAAVDDFVAAVDTGRYF